jgi:hypothetical protein
MSYNRETGRDALQTLLNTALVGTGLPVQETYNYQVGDFKNKTPVVTVTSAGAERDQLSLSTRRISAFFYNIHVFVLYADTTSGWTEANAEDALDLIESKIDQTIAANLVTPNWRDIGYAGRTTAGSVTIGGEEYRYEVIPVRVEVAHD